MNKKDLKLLIDLCSVQSSTKEDEDIMNFIEDWLGKQPVIVKKDTFGNIYVTKGQAETYPCIVSHTDTVHTIRKDYRVFQSGDYVFAMSGGEQTGVGGDDRCGIWACMKAIQTLPQVKAVFFRFEETGMNGSRNADMSFFNDVRHVIQFDRKGNNEWIIWSNGVSISTKAFEDRLEASGLLEKYQFKLANGIATDVGQLIKNGLKVCAANLGCGYFNPHSKSEYINLIDLERTWDLYVEFVEKFTEIEPMSKPAIIIPDEEHVELYLPPTHSKVKYQQDLFEKGWFALLDWIVSQPEAEFNETLAALWEDHMEYWDRKTNPKKTKNPFDTDSDDDVIPCGPTKCWSNMMPDKTVGGENILHCIECGKEFPDPDKGVRDILDKYSKIDGYGNQFGLFSDL